MKPIKHVFWDFDGTLYDSYPTVTKAIREALISLGMADDEDAAPDRLLALLKQSFYHAACHFAARHQLDPQAVMAAFRAHHDGIDQFPLYAGAADCIQQTHAAGITHYLYTHRDRIAVRCLERDGLWRDFADGVTREDGFPGKPAPDALLALMARNGVSPDEAVMIGDRDIDLQSGYNAGMRSILFDPDGFYQNVQADLKTVSMPEITKFLLRNLS